jgi:hypothetical protein
VIVHSFDGVLRQPRTMHSFDVPGLSQRRIALPRPVPFIALVYFALVELLVVMSDNVVGYSNAIGDVLSAVSGGRADLTAWLICYAIVPAAIVWLSMNVEIDGRSPHRWIVSMIRLAVSCRRTRCGISVPADGSRFSYRGRLRVWWDESAPRLHHGWVVGGTLSTRVPARFTFAAVRHRHRVIKADHDYAPVERFEVPGRVEVRP